MDIFIGIIAIIGGLAAVDMAALRWGKKGRSNGYEPRREWHSIAQ